MSNVYKTIKRLLGYEPELNNPSYELFDNCDTTNIFGLYESATDEKSEDTTTYDNLQVKCMYYKQFIRYLYGMLKKHTRLSPSSDKDRQTLFHEICENLKDVAIIYRSRTALGYGDIVTGDKICEFLAKYVKKIYFLIEHDGLPRYDYDKFIDGIKERYDKKKLNIEIIVYVREDNSEVPIVKNLITDITHIGTDVDSAFGNVFSFKLNDIDVILKYSMKKNVIKNNHLTHELLVGYILNDLRDTIPNFMYTYGGLYCNSPVSYAGTDKEGRDIIDFDINKLCRQKVLCKHKKERIDCDICKKNQCKIHNTNTTVENCDECKNYKTLMCFFEHIPKATSMEKYIIAWFDKYITYISKPTLNFVEFFSHIEEFQTILLQIIFAMYTAKNKFGFIHGDLNLNNVLVRNKGKKIDIDYNIGMIGKLRTERVVQIIDYGFSTINYNTVSYKSPTYLKLKRNFNEYFVENDLMFIMNAIELYMDHVKIKYPYTKFWKDFHIIGNAMINYYDVVRNLEQHPQKPYPKDYVTRYPLVYKATYSNSINDIVNILVKSDHEPMSP